MSTPETGDQASTALTVRPPQQKRTREAWERILNAGVSLLEEGGYEAFTIAAVCDRARVAPRAVYDRVDDKDSLFLAVYEHGVARVRADEEVFAEGPRWRALPPDRVVAEAVRELAAIFTRHAAFMRSVVLISGVHQEVYRRGAEYSRELGDRFGAVVLQTRDHIEHDDPERAIELIFNTLFSTMVLRTAYGPAFAVRPTGDEVFLEMLVAMAQRYLFR